MPQTAEELIHAEGRRLFGLDPEGYELVTSGPLYPGAATLEVGPGSGRATGRRVEHGADPLLLIKPDTRFAEVLS